MLMLEKQEDHLEQESRSTEKNCRVSQEHSAEQLRPGQQVFSTSQQLQAKCPAQSPDRLGECAGDVS